MDRPVSQCRKHDGDADHEESKSTRDRVCYPKDSSLRRSHLRERARGLGHYQTSFYV
jgi:hypothetical protein